VNEFLMPHYGPYVASEQNMDRDVFLNLFDIMGCAVNIYMFGPCLRRSRLTLVLSIKMLKIFKKL
jgi:hypothetical protein